MDLAERAFPRQVAAARDRHTAVEGRRELQQDERPASRHARDESFVQPHGLFPQETLFDRDPGIAQRAKAPAVRPRIGILHRRDDARDARLLHRVDARGRPPGVRAGLEVRVQGRAPCRGAGPAERVHLGVRLARGMVIALAHDAVVLHDDGADERVRAGATCRPPGEAERAAHVADVVGHVR